MKNLILKHSNLNQTNDTVCVYTPYEQRLETYLIPILFFIIFIVGVIGNGVLVVIFIRHPTMRSIPNTYIFSLALADLLILITCVPFTSIVYTTETYPWGEAVCKISECVKDITVGVSVFTLTALSVERYCAIANPLRKLHTKSIAKFTVTLIWIVATAFALPNLVFSGIRTRPKYDSIGRDNDTLQICYPFPEIENYEQYSIVIKFFIYYVIPLFILGYFYILMAIHLHTSTKRMPGDVQHTQGISQVRSRKHLARMVLVFVFLFFICFLPQQIFLLWFFLNPKSEEEYNEWWHALKMIGFCLSFLNSCVNPVALYCISGVFRAYFNRYLFCKGPTWSPQENSFATISFSASSTMRKRI
ncbi:neuropeptide CCHamide-2 receptor-like [Anthonomus grandis grandis]|uniref:neuropeptide CCHamide-2 receptor-like n=1 Tax=Anthonomus grandis grandis TaxID=2921223 RepID=UPI0021666DDD|nr:neuropeptide CCHamide-2 receptor-like [Anthonomus grandis grandis]